METLQIVEYRVVTFKKETILKTETIKEGASSVVKTRSKIISTVKKDLEQTVIDQGGASSHLGLFSCIYVAGKKLPWGLISHRPAFTYHVMTEPFQIIDFLNIHAPGAKI